MLAVFAVLAAPVSAGALDTVETFDPGNVDVEIFGGLHGFKGGRHFDGFDVELALNYGLMDRFSIYGKGQIGTDGSFLEPRGGAAFGMLGTVVDTEHFDMDLMLEFGFGDYGAVLVPAVEFNFDLVRDRRKWGAYLRVEEILTGDPVVGSFTPYTVLTAGTYWTIVDGHKLLAEYDMQFAANPRAGGRVVDVGAVALGYNVDIGHDVDLIADVHCDIPQSGEDVAFGFSIGFKVYGVNRR